MEYKGSCSKRGPATLLVVQERRRAMKEERQGGFMPKRIQRKRTKGWRKPEGAVYVGRGSVWGNRWRTSNENPVWAVRMFRLHAKYKLIQEPEWLEPLRGKDLMCWCPLTDERGNSVPCHADVLLELANK